MRAISEEAKDERRQVLLQAALDTFYENGFTAARMDDIAARAGLSKGAIYLYFDSKDALFEGLVETIALPRVEQIEALLGSAPSATAAIHHMMLFARALVEHSPMPRIMKVLVADSGRFPDAAQAYRKRVVERILGVIASVLERGREAGEFKIDDPALTARLVIAPIVLSAMWRVTFGHDPDAAIDLEALFVLHEKMILRALTPQPGEGA